MALGSPPRPIEALQHLIRSPIPSLGGVGTYLETIYATIEN